MTAGDIIRATLRLIGAIDPEETPSNAEMQSGLEAMQLMLEGWSTEGLTIPYITTENYTLSVGTASYTYGSDGDFNASRPQAILDAYTRRSGTDIPVKIIGEREYNRISSKGSSGRPERLYYVPEYPLGKVYLDHAPDVAYDLYLDVTKPLTTPTGLTSNISFPPGYDRAIKFNLCAEIAPEFMTPVSSEVAVLAMDSKKFIQNQSLRVPELSATDGVRAYDIITQ